MRRRVRDFMEGSSSMVVTSYARKRKAEFDQEEEEEEEESDGENEEGKAKIEERQAPIDYLKGFYGDPELKPSFHYKAIVPMELERQALRDINYREFWEEMVYVCLQKLNQDKDSNVEFVEVVRGYYRPGPRSNSYITFMAREKPDGPLVEYQAKCMVALDRKRHPILCRPAPMPKS